MIIRANKTLIEYLKELSCSELLYNKILRINHISRGILLSDKINTYDQLFNTYDLFNNYIVFDCFDIYPGITNQIYRFRYDYVEIDSLENLTSILNKYLRLKAFI